MKKILIICMMFLAVTSIGYAKNINDNSKINLVWQPTFEKANDLSVHSKITGVNVVSPSFFTIVNKNGFIKNDINDKYIKGVRKRGYKIWPLVSNNFDKNVTHEFLHDDDARAYIIRQLIFYAEKDKFDGYNIDFENIYEADRDILVDFIKQLAEAMHKNGLILSIDVTVPSDDPVWSKCYDRKKLADYADYIVLMAYDEHSRVSKVSGSVASIGWVETGIKNTLKQGVPAEKLILGVPLYMRLWQEKNGELLVKTLTMPDAEKLIKQNNIQPQWDKSAGQYYFSYRDLANHQYFVWQENAASLKLKLLLIKKYNMAGFASWRKGFETKDIWPLFAQFINDN
ncbi:glycosyl hydrolase family 18 protein [Pectinatus sottacetonis]|uniref:glycosyl hydrolase family 18 protein n=1 Tax=Pectinatus sottacetonis TaxID=1002795 RepID=UPI001E5A6349|nr:glycosyl hydrolase family 18 protein [Pectinatus sottacetonis]